jgi:formylglycine-generating enzyme required for sulfatase activity
MLQVLAGPGKAYMQDTQRLKYLLAPVVCRNAAEQERFYEVFDRFLVESGEWRGEGPSGRGGDRFAIGWRSLRDWVKLGFLGVLGVGAFLIWFIGGEKKPVPVLGMEHPFDIAVGDTLFLRNTTENLDTQRYRTYWELYGYDEAGRETLLAADSAGGDWAAPIDTIGDIPALWAHLKAIPVKKGDTLAIDRRIRVNCSDMPPEVQIIAPGTAEPGQQLRFSFSGVIDRNLRYRWIFEGKDTLEAATAQRAFPEVGSQTVALLIDRPGAAGYCQREVYHQIQIGQEKVRLEPLPLLKVPQEPHWAFAIGTWLLLGLLGLALLIAWLKWLTRKPPPPNHQSPITNHQSPRFSAADRAPYFIPFRDTNRLIAPSREPQRLADVLRLRHEGLRLELDVPASVKSTIEGGGFPALRQRYNTQPADYLFLVDEQSSASHQARLFRYLAALLRERDVHMEVFFYKDEPVRVWNAEFPNGLALEQVQRLYPVHRLALIGEGRGLLDPWAVGQHQVRPGLAAALRSWKQRILLTPAPPRAWGYQEAALQGLFTLFPADLQGMAQAAAYLEAGLEASDLPLTFKAWKEQLEVPRSDPDPQFRRWRTAAEHREYLKDKPEIFRWLCATAVYPKPTWELTIAIGEALGLRVTYDDLLIFSRIPWLQSGDLHPRLREELLAYVMPGDERLARQAVRAELAAVAETAARGAANQELQINIAVQDFALEPENPEFRDTIRELLDAGLLTRRHEAELDQVLRKTQIFTQNNIGSKSMEEKAPTIRDYLRPPSTINDKRSTRPFPRLALALTALWLLLFASIWAMINQNTLDKRFPPTEKQRNFFFVKETFYIDNAVIYNNQGVDTFYADPAQGLRAAAYFEKAAGLTVADTNLLKLYYNLGLNQYDSLIHSPITNHQSPITFFQNALPLTAALHALGLTHFYQENRDSALFDYEFLVAQTDSLFFDTTTIFPNLETLLFPDRPPGIRDVKIKETRDGGLEVWATYFHNVRLYPQLSLEAAPLLANGKIPPGFTPVAKVLPGGAGEVDLKILITNIQSPITTTRIRLRMRASGGAVVDERLISHSHEWGKREPVKLREEIRDTTPPVKEEQPPVRQDTLPDKEIQPPPKDQTPEQQPPAVQPVFPEMVTVKGGRFDMGDVMKDQEFNNETVHSVTLGDFQIGKYEVTFEEFDAFCEATRREKPSDEGWGRGKRPVINVNWFDAVAYCNWLSEQAKLTPVYTIRGEDVTANWRANGYRLPTEAEWEYAARGRGKKVRFGNGKDIADPKEINFDASKEQKMPYSVIGEYRGKTVPVGSLNSPNALGLHDMSGNVWEWCWDWHADYPTRAVTNPRGGEKGSNRVYRGGSWFEFPHFCRAANRYYDRPASRGGYVGFRLARAL